MSEPNGVHLSPCLGCSDPTQPHIVTPAAAPESTPPAPPRRRKPRTPLASKAGGA